MKSVLMVFPNAFPTGWMGATRRMFHLAKAFISLGWDVSLFAAKANNPAIQNAIDASFPGRVIRTGPNGAYPALAGRSPFTRRVWRAGWKIRGENYLLSKLSFGWAELLKMSKINQELKKAGIKPDLIWGVSGGLLEGGVAAKRLSEWMAIPWVFELQDPPYGCGLGNRNPIMERCFTRLLQHAGAVVTTTSSYSKVLHRTYGHALKGMPHTIHLTCDEEQGENATPAEGGWRLFYGGALYGGRSFVPVLKGVKAALEAEPSLRGSLQIELAGSGAGYKEMERFALNNGLSNVVNYYGIMAAEDVGRLISKAAVTIAIQPNAPLQIPGKVFELLKGGKPVLGIMPPECEAAAILRRSGLGFIHSPDDTMGIGDTLARLWRAWRDGKAPVVPDQEYISGFSIKRLPEKLAIVLSEALGECPLRF